MHLGTENHRLGKIPKILGYLMTLIVVILSLIVLTLGWGADSKEFTNFGNQFSAMAPSTAILFLTSSASLFAFHHFPKSVQWGLVVRLVGLAVIALALTNLSILLSGWNAGIDQLIWPSSVEFNQAKMSEASSIGFLCLGACMVQISAKSGPYRIAISSASLGVSITLLALIVFSLDARSLSTAAMYSSLSLPTAVAFLLLFADVLLNLREFGWMKILLGSGRGSTGLRRLLPWVIGLPLALILWTNYAMEEQVFDENFRLSLLTTGMVVGLSAILFRYAGKSNRLEISTAAAMARAAAAEAERAKQQRQQEQAENTSQAKNEIFGQYEPRDPHAYEWYTRLFGPPTQRRSDPRTAPKGQPHSRIRSDNAQVDRRYSGFIEGRNRSYCNAQRAGRHPPQGWQLRPAFQSFRDQKGTCARKPYRCRFAARASDRQAEASANSEQPNRQCREVYA